MFMSYKLLAKKMNSELLHLLEMFAKDQCFAHLVWGYFTGVAFSIKLKFFLLLKDFEFHLHTIENFPLTYFTQFVKIINIIVFLESS
jgi:hypothetical protein